MRDARKLGGEIEWLEGGRKEVWTKGGARKHDHKKRSLAVMRGGGVGLLIVLFD